MEKVIQLITIFLIIYLIIDKRRNHKTWQDLGVNIKNITLGLRKNWHLILLVGLVFSLLTFFVGKYLVTGYTDHVISRVPMNINVIMPTLITIVIGTLLEELLYRGFLQQKVAKKIGTNKAIIVTSFIFALMHFSADKFSIVSYDILTIVIDSILYGIIFSRSKNVFVSWIGHLLSDLVGLICILFFI